MEHSPDIMGSFTLQTVRARIMTSIMVLDFIHSYDTGCPTTIPKADTDKCFEFLCHRGPDQYLLLAVQSEVRSTLTVGAAELAAGTSWSG